MSDIRARLKFLRELPESQIIVEVTYERYNDSEPMTTVGYWSDRLTTNIWIEQFKEYKDSRYIGFVMIEDHHVKSIRLMGEYDFL